MVVSLKNLPQKVGVIGGGQLARMLALTSRGIGVEVVILAQSISDCAIEVTGEYFIDDGSDTLLERFLSGVEVVTIENEFIDLDRFERVLENLPTKKIFPTIETLRLVQ